MVFSPLLHMHKSAHRCEVAFPKLVMGNQSHFCKSWKFDAVFPRNGNLCCECQVLSRFNHSSLSHGAQMWPQNPSHTLIVYTTLGIVLLITDYEWCLLELCSAHARSNLVFMLALPSDRSLYINCLLNLNPNQQQIQQLPQNTKVFIIHIDILFEPHY